MPLPSFEPHHRNIHKTCADIRLGVWCQPTIFKKSKRMNEIQIFNNDQFGNVRVTMNENNEPLFCLTDVCNVIGIANARNVKSRLDEDDVRRVDSIDSLGRNQQVTFITESGLYDVIIRSDNKNAKPFRRWVTSEVLPSIRKHGVYMTENTLEKALLSPDYLIQLATKIKEEQQMRILAEEKIQRQAKIIQHKSDVIEGLVDDLPLAELRQRVNQIVRYGRNKGFQERFRLLYKEFGLKHHVDLDRRFNSKKAEELNITSKIDYIDRVLHKIPQLYDLACKLFETDVKNLIEKEWKLKIN